MSGVYEILSKIREKPGMYIGRPSVSDLFMFLVGYECRSSELEIDNLNFISIEGGGHNDLFNFETYHKSIDQ